MRRVLSKVPKMSLLGASTTLILSSLDEPFKTDPYFTDYRDEFKIKKTEYAEYWVGNSPLIILSQHGGSEKPSSIPRRRGRGVVTKNDARTQCIAKCLHRKTYFEHNNKFLYPHLIMNHLHRTKLDANRPIDIAALENEIAKKTWNDIHINFMEQAKKQAIEQFGFALVVDIGSFSHS